MHTDLLAAGLIPDPYLDENELALGWIGQQEWRYRTTVHWFPTDPARTDLVCDGLDTVATIALNGVEVGSTFNQHRSYRFDVSHVLRPGANEFEISFASAWEYAESVESELGPLPNAYPAPFNFIRKMACNFGWDWGPGLVTAGICRPIALETWTTARIAEVRPALMVNGSAGRVELAVDLEKAATVELTVGASIGGTHVEATLAADSDSTLLVPRRPGRRSVVAARSGITAAVRPHHRTLRRRGVPGRLAIPGRVPHDRAEHRSRRDRFCLHACRQRGADLRARRQLDSGRLPSRADRPGAAADPSHPSDRGQPEPVAGLGRWPLRIGRLLLVVRRTRGVGLAGLPVRLRGLSRGETGARRGDRRGTGERDSVDAAPEPGDVERLQRKHLGMATES